MNDVFRSPGRARFELYVRSCELMAVAINYYVNEWGRRSGSVGSLYIDIDQFLLTTASEAEAVGLKWQPTRNAFIEELDLIKVRRELDAYFRLSAADLPQPA